MSDAVIVESSGGVVEVRLNRPEKRNAIDSEIIEGLLRALKTIRENRSARVVVLSGEGRGFCAGLDMANFGNMVSGDLSAEGAAEAYEYGIATMLSDNPRQQALKLARTMAGRNPDAVRAGKKLLNDAMFNSTYDGLVAESNCSRKLIGTPNQIEAIMSGFESREPKFSDPG